MFNQKYLSETNKSEEFGTKSSLATPMVEQKRRLYEQQKKQAEIDRLNEFTRPLNLPAKRESNSRMEMEGYYQHFNWLY